MNLGGVKEWQGVKSRGQSQCIQEPYNSCRIWVEEPILYLITPVESGLRLIGVFLITPVESGSLS